jgi:hypothetical protein
VEEVHDPMSSTESDLFALDRVTNPHPVMLRHALQLRRAARVSHDPILGATWLGYRDAMCDATGERPEDIEAWMDRNDDTSAVVEQTSAYVPAPKRKPR